MKQKDKELYMDIAHRVAQQSYAVRLKVGAVFVADSGVMSIGYNGTLPGHDNCCEDVVATWSGECEKLVTKPAVIHAELNLLGKLLEEGVSAKGGTLFLTHSPCIECAKLLAKAKLKEVFYGKLYRSSDGIDFLNTTEVKIEKWEP